METGLFQSIQRGGHIDFVVTLGQSIDNPGQSLLVDLLIYERVGNRQRFIEEATPNRGFELDRIALFKALRSLPTLRRHRARLKPNQRSGVNIQAILVEGHNGFTQRRELGGNRVSVLVGRNR